MAIELYRDGQLLTPELYEKLDTSALVPAIRKEARKFLQRNKDYLLGLPIGMIQQMLEHRAQGRNMRELHTALVAAMSDDEIADYTRYAVMQLKEAASNYLRAVALWDDIRRTVTSVLAMGLNVLFAQVRV